MRMNTSQKIINSFLCNNLISFQKSTGFTLAEVLITLGIIGVVAAMTIPQLVKNTQDYQFKQAWKKQYSVLSAAHKMVVNETPPPMGYTDFATGFEKQIKVLKTCTSPMTQGCWHANNAWKSFDGTAIATPPNQIQNGYVLQDGTYLMYFGFQGGYCSPTSLIDGGTCFVFVVDVNGAKLPNQEGYDIFAAEIFSDAIRPCGSRNTSWSNCGAGGGWSSGTGCSHNALMGISY